MPPTSPPIRGLWSLQVTDLLIALGKRETEKERERGEGQESGDGENSLCLGSHFVALAPAKVCAAQHGSHSRVGHAQNVARQN